MPRPVTSPLVLLLQATVGLLGEADAMATDPALVRAVDLAQRALAGLLPTGDLDSGIEAMVALSDLVVAEVE